MRNIPVILNPCAGAGLAQEKVEHLRAFFAAAGVDARITVPKAREEIHAIASAAIAGPEPLLVAGGGDGTLSAVAQVLRGTDTALGILPLGTLNHFAKDLGVPLDVEEAVATALGGQRLAVDVGEVNGKSFLNNSSLGIYPDMVRERTRQEHRLGRGRRWATFWAALAALRRFPFLDLQLELDERRQHCRAPFVFVGNNNYEMSAFSIGTRKGLEDGRLSVYLSPRSTRSGLLALALRALFGRLRQARDFAAMSARSLRVESRYRELLVATDGEIGMMQTPLEYLIRPRSLIVMVPDRAG